MMANGRTRERFDDDWRFYLGDIDMPPTVKAGQMGGLADVVEQKRKTGDAVAFTDRRTRLKVDPDRWPAVSLPHDFLVDLPFVNDKKLVTHGFKPHGVGFYRKVFALPPRDAGRSVVLEFDGIYRNSSVWLNGHHLADHESGYTSFRVDISDAARYGEEGLNCVLVRVDARADEGWWYEGGGIYRHAWLTKANPVRVGQWGTRITTPRVGARAAEVRVETTVVNGTGKDAQVTVETVVVDAGGRRVATGRTTVAAVAAGTAVAAQRFSVSRPRLWSLEHPNLYRALTTLSIGGKAVDAYATTFGIRTIRFDPTRGFFLNGVHTAVKGTCNHQDFAGVGVALPDSIHEYKIKVLKGMGCNAYRCAHHPPAPELLDACDRLGMLVLDENRRLDSSPRGLADLDAMILRDRNHPSVFVWGMENEEKLEGTPMGARILSTLVRRARLLDPTRPTIAAQNHGHVRMYQGLTGLAGFNYGHNNDKDLAYHRANPDQPVFPTESNATCSTRGEYENDPKQGFTNAYGDTMATPPWPWNDQFEKAWSKYLADPALFGVFVWAGFDYRGEPTPFGWPNVTTQYGILDACGFPKDAGEYHRVMFSDRPAIHLMPHWTWPGREGKEIKVWILANLEWVELRLNGRYLGGRLVKSGFHVEFMVKYEPGELKATGYRGGRAVVETVVSTTGRPAALRLEPDRTKMKPDGRDAVPIRIAVVDSAGRVCPTADPLVRFKVSGPSRIIGVGNGHPASHEPDVASYRRAFHGRCLAIVQSEGRKGRVLFSARSAGLKSARCLIRAV
jgi:beta-galactosidase